MSVVTNNHISCNPPPMGVTSFLNGPKRKKKKSNSEKTTLLHILFWPDSWYTKGIKSCFQINKSMLFFRKKTIYTRQRGGGEIKCQYYSSPLPFDQAARLRRYYSFCGVYLVTFIFGCTHVFIDIRSFTPLI